MKKYLYLFLLPLLALTACDSNDGPDEDITIEEIVVGTGTTATSGSVAEVAYELSVVGVAGCEQSGALDFRIDGGEMIDGFNQGVKGMKVGGTRRITVPPSLGYGSRGKGCVPPNSTLIFVVTLENVR